MGIDLNSVALWVGWAVLGIGGVLAAAAVVTFVPYAILSIFWHYLKVQDDFIQIGMMYMKEKKRKAREEGTVAP
jgi:chromate transport protein ChrA